MTYNLTLSNRFHEIIRQTSIRTIQEALVELITNCDDAYQTFPTKKIIIIEVIRREDYVDILVIDQAKGMTKDEMVEKLLTVGNFTAHNQARGMMGRGAKDCSFLGDITFSCIKTDILNELVIHQDRTADFIISNYKVSNQERLKYRIVNNGCHVKLSVKSSLVPSINDLKNSLENNIYLRTLLTDENIILLLQERAINFNERLQYIYPDRILLIKCDYEIPEYDTIAHLEIYKSNTEMKHSFKPDETQYGILVGSGRSVYECSGLYYQDKDKPIQDLFWNPNIKYISGILTCSHLDKLAREASNGNLNDKNPYIIIDPNRRAGIIKDHPFTIALYSKAYNILSIIIDRLQDDKDDGLLENGSAQDIFAGLNSLINDLLPAENFLYTWRTRETQEKLNILSKTNLSNLELNDKFLGLKWEDLQNLKEKQYLPTSNNSNFKIGFTNDKNLKTSYQIIYLPQHIQIKININDPSLKNYITIEDDHVEFLNNERVLTSVGFILMDATLNMLFRRQILDGKTSTIDINGFNEYLFHNSDARHNISTKIFEHIYSGIDILSATK